MFFISTFQLMYYESCILVDLSGVGNNNSDKKRLQNPCHSFELKNKHQGNGVS